MAGRGARFAGGLAVSGVRKAIRSPPALHHIPLYSPLYGGVYRAGLVTCCLFLPESPATAKLETLNAVPGARFAGGLAVSGVRKAARVTWSIRRLRPPLARAQERNEDTSPWRYTVHPQVPLSSYASILGDTCLGVGVP